MAIVTGSGISGQVMLAAESAWGTAVTATRGYEIVSENIQAVPDHVESAGIRSGQRLIRSDDWALGMIRVGGPMEYELSTRNLALLLEHSLGTVTSMAGPTPGTLSPADLTGKGMTVQVGRPDVAGTVIPYTFSGGKVSSWDVSCAVGEIAKLSIDWVFKDQTTATALAAASYTSGLGLFAFTHGVVTIGGTTVSVRNVRLGGLNNLNVQRDFMGGTNIAEPIETGRRDYTVALELDHNGTVLPGRITSGAESAMTLTFTSGGSIVKFTTNTRWDDGFANLGGMDILTQPLTGKLVATGADSTALLVHVTSGETAP